jgi:XTP/dITP diphosphohydrolase
MASLMAEPIRLVIATNNPGKVAEFRALLALSGTEVVALSDFPSMPEVAETAASYVDNARAKARAAAAHTRLPSLADDSGLEVDALDGAPGIRSARYAADADRGRGDAANIALLLEHLQDVADERRNARFRCVIVVAAPDGRELTGSGTCDGRIARQPRGQHGFGYDPIFYDPASAATFAELSPERKHAISHRARACDALRRDLIDFLRPTYP